MDGASNICRHSARRCGKKKRRAGMAYSCNVYRYFDFDETDLIYTGRELIILGARSRVCIAHFEQGTLFDTVKHVLGKKTISVEVGECTYSCPLSHEFECDDVFGCKRALIGEVVAFVSRTHSLRNPMCRCAHKLPHSRILDYGLDPTKKAETHQVCPLMATENRVTSQHIANEIKVQSLDATLVGSESILSILQQSLLLTQDEHGRWTLAQPHVVHDQSSLHSYVRQQWSGVDLDDVNIQYPNVIRDLYSLDAKGKVLIFKSQNRVFRNTVQQKRCDQDIIDMWKRAK